jgi:hypothetical protein
VLSIQHLPDYFSACPSTKEALPPVEMNGPDRAFSPILYEFGITNRRLKCASTLGFLMRFNGGASTPELACL